MPGKTLAPRSLRVGQQGPIQLHPVVIAQGLVQPARFAPDPARQLRGGSALVEQFTHLGPVLPACGPQRLPHRAAFWQAQVFFQQVASLHHVHQGDTERIRFFFHTLGVRVG